MAVSTDPEHRFELALALEDMSTAHELAKEANSQQKWRQLASLATQQGKLDLVRECLSNAEDHAGLLLLATSTGNSDLIKQIASDTDNLGKNNISFLTNFLLCDIDKCLEILIKTDRIPEAAIFASTYAPSRMSECVKLWKAKLAKTNEKAAAALADPEEYPNLFPGYREALEVERYMREQYKKQIPAHMYDQLKVSFCRNKILIL